MTNKHTGVRRGGPSQAVTVVPTLEQLVNDATSLIAFEFTRFREKQMLGAALDARDHKSIADLIGALCRMSKESRETVRAQDLSNLTDEELLEMVSKMVADKAKGIEAVGAPSRDLEAPSKQIEPSNEDEN